MDTNTIRSVDLPLISRKGLIRLLDMVSPRDFNKETTLYDTGYEQAKKDIAVILEDELNVHIESNPASRLAKHLRRG